MTHQPAATMLRYQPAASLVMTHQPAATMLRYQPAASPKVSGITNPPAAAGRMPSGVA